MKAHWYCTDCDTRIEKDEIEHHEKRGHTVRGKLRPDRLLANDPWQVGEEPHTDGEGDR